MNPEVIATIVAGLLLLIGLVGIIVPVLPGSITIIVGLLVWALVLGSPLGWIVFGIGTMFCLCGMVATYVLTGRAMRREKIPNRSVLVGIVCGIIGLFVIPALGLPIGFVVGLFLSELVRVKDFRTAIRTSWQAIRATGLGMLVEFCLAGLAVGTWVIGAWRYFSLVAA